MARWGRLKRKQERISEKGTDRERVGTVTAATTNPRRVALLSVDWVLVGLPDFPLQA